MRPKFVVVQHPGLSEVDRFLGGNLGTRVVRQPIVEMIHVLIALGSNPKDLILLKETIFLLVKYRTL